MTDQTPSATEFVMPVPGDAPVFLTDVLNGLTTLHTYLDGEGRVLFHIGRFETSDREGGTKKHFQPFSYARQADGSCAWIGKAPPAPRPLYGLDRLAARPDAVVVLTEGEKCADVAQAAWPDDVVMTWPGGSGGVGAADLSPLAGRDVVILPDNDEPGAKAARRLRERLGEVGVASVRTVDIESLGRTVAQTDDPSGYDIADALADGLSVAGIDELLTFFELEFDRPVCVPGTLVDESDGALREEREAEENAIHRYLREAYGHVVDLPQEFQLTEDGVIYCYEGRDGPQRSFVCSPLAIIGLTRSDPYTGHGWGYLVAYRNRLGEWGILTIPGHLLAGDAKEVREILIRHGVVCPQDRHGRQLLSELIAFSHADEVYEVAARPGWHGPSFAMPHHVVTPDGEPKVLPPLDQHAGEHFRTGGEMDGWRDLAAAVGKNSRGAFALSAAFAGPLLRGCGETGGGFHLHAKSSRGKTTLLKASASVWGGGGRVGAVRSWSITANGGEGLAALHNDSLLTLDEISLAAPDEIEVILYRLAKWTGKVEGDEIGCLGRFCGLEFHDPVLGRDAGRRAVAGGLGVRMVDVPHRLDDGRAFEALGEHRSERAFAEWIGRQADAHYGHAGPAFVEKLVAEHDEAFAFARARAETFVRHVTDDHDDPQVARVARRFGVVAAAGELATQWDVVPWERDDATRAARACFLAWRDARGSSASTDDIEALRQVQAFFEAHGAARFEALRGDDYGTIRDRCGHRGEIDGELRYLVFPQAWRTEVCAGIDPVRAAQLLRDRGALIPGDGDHLAKKERLPGHETARRVYVIRADKLHD